MIITTDPAVADVGRAVEEGFAKKIKSLPSWLFYDEAGDRIFQEIMRMPEYYLTRCEYSILQRVKRTLREYFRAGSDPFLLVELGAGDGLKTEILLEDFVAHGVDFSYVPVDVSDAVLSQLSERLQDSVPGLDVRPVNKRYDDALAALGDEQLRKVFLFMGANIGNFKVEEAIGFAQSICEVMHAKDQILIGFDMKKDPRLVVAAYDDPHGITRRFNMNLLVRLNRELGAQFRLEDFSHYPYYNPETGLTKSYLVSLKDQDIYLAACNRTVHFDRWELIHTEVSQKYDMEMIRNLATKSGLVIRDVFYDKDQYFCDVLFAKG